MQLGPHDDARSSALWNHERASKIRLLEVRGALPDEVTCPETKVTFEVEKGTVPKRSHYACGACGTVQDLLTTVKASNKTGPMAAYAVQAYAPKRDAMGKPYGGRYFAAYDTAPNAPVVIQLVRFARDEDGVVIDAGDIALL